MRKCLRQGRVNIIGRKPGSIRYITSSSRLKPKPSIPAKRECTPSVLKIRKPFSRSRSHRDDDPQSWIGLLDQYLPLKLRQTTAQLGREEGQCDALRGLLAKSRKETGVDLLTYIGIKHARWPAVYAAINRILDEAETLKPAVRRRRLPSSFEWGEVGTMEEVAEHYPLSRHKNNPISCRDPSRPSLDDFDMFAQESAMHNQMGDGRLLNKGMEILWPTLGSLVLEAADLPAAESQVAMSYFYRTLARLHHMDFIPHTVYENILPQDPYTMGRPPAMHLLSSRIMHVLTDAVWSADQADAVAEAIAAGEDPPVTRFKMRTRQLAPEVWMEFVLWCCVEGGYASEGVWILEQLRKRQNKWSIKYWDNVFPKGGQIDASRIDGCETWALCEVKSKEPMQRSPDPFLGMGKRIISSEVVVALMDGLFNNISTVVGTRGDAPSNISNYVRMVSSLLQENQFTLSPGDFNSLVVRMVETGAVVPEATPRIPKEFLENAPRIWPRLPKAFSSISPLRILYNNSAFLPGFYQYLLNIFASKGHILEAIDTFYKLFPAIKDATDTPLLSQSITTAEGQSSIELISEKDIDQPSIPLSTLTLRILLDAATNAGEHRFANKLFSSEGPNGPLIPASSQGDALLIPAILRHMTATDPNQLAIKISDIGDGSHFSVTVIKELISHSIEYREFEVTRKLLGVVQKPKTGQWGVRHVTHLAAVILELEGPINPDKMASDTSSADEQARLGSLEQATQLMVDILNGDFDRKPDYSRRLHHINYSSATLHKLAKMFRSIPSALSDAVSEVPLLQTDPPRGYVREIPGYAFNRFMSAVVETRGSITGKRLWENWCTMPIPTTGAKQIRGDNYNNNNNNNTPIPRYRGHIHLQLPHHTFDGASKTKNIGKVAAADLTTLRIIMRAAYNDLNGLKHGREPVSRGMRPDRVQHVINWCQFRFRDFGLRSEDIEIERQDCLRRVRERNNATTTATTIPTAATATVATVATAEKGEEEIGVLKEKEERVGEK
ncbi:hypothetical protein AJ80_02589 [Polytolypa hystricis UAMH7299]|uniref:Uncharacterized protein n=1 Tax=Polytolypa hystricis (strain UAMH7299) TaxID=1447883 RepID=A0A2B7YNW2_POLH7|nr:hypothetical protein AJ80_02589 [Polytolypa hystricis UAMH7299]